MSYFDSEVKNSSMLLKGAISMPSSILLRQDSSFLKIKTIKNIVFSIKTFHKFHFLVLVPDHWITLKPCSEAVRPEVQTPHPGQVWWQWYGLVAGKYQWPECTTNTGTGREYWQQCAALDGCMAVNTHLTGIYFEVDVINDSLVNAFINLCEVF